MTTFGKLIIAGMFSAGLISFWYVALNAPEEGEQVKEEIVVATTTETATVPTAKKMAFSVFMKQGGSYRCTVSQLVQDIESNGTVYIADGLFYGDFVTTVKGMTMQSSSLVRDGYVYTWTSMSPLSGFKMKIPDASADPVVQASSSAPSFSFDTFGDYTCESWSKDMSKFDIPAKITYKILPQ